MITKVVNFLKYFGVFSLVCIGLLSCEKDIESVGVNLVNNNTFETDAEVYEVVTNTVNIERVQGNGLSQYLLGVYADTEFGAMKASLVSQLLPPAIDTNYTYGTNVVLDSVILDIPYQTTLDSVDTNGFSNFSLDSIIGKKDVAFNIKIYELQTFLNTLDPNDPSKNAIYYTDKEFQKGSELFHDGSFKVNENDTVAYIDRYLEDGITKFDRDTIKNDDLTPSIKLPLDKDLIKQYFVDNAESGDFATFDDFRSYFRGFYIEANPINGNYNSHLISLAFSNAKMIVYYSINEDEAEGIDLNDNDVTGEQGVRTSYAYNFLLSGVRSNVIERDYSVSKASGLNNLYVQGTNGSEATIELFTEASLADLQSKNRLINNAEIEFYVNQESLNNSDIVPSQLFIYNYDDSIQILDALTEGISAIGGSLEYDENEKPYKYVFNITDYVSELFSMNEDVELVKLGLKVYNPTDALSAEISDISWIPKGVVLHGDDISAGDKRVTLKISYTELTPN
jgi:hypothetical protein